MKAPGLLGVIEACWNGRIAVARGLLDYIAPGITADANTREGYHAYVVSVDVGGPFTYGVVVQRDGEREGELSGTADGSRVDVEAIGTLRLVYRCEARASPPSSSTQATRFSNRLRAVSVPDPVRHLVEKVEQGPCKVVWASQNEAAYAYRFARAAAKQVLYGIAVTLPSETVSVAQLGCARRPRRKVGVSPETPAAASSATSVHAVQAALARYLSQTHVRDRGQGAAWFGALMLWACRSITADDHPRRKYAN